MACVMRALAQGHSLTYAAQEAGFASSAHLSSSFRNMFGLSPAQLLARNIVIDIEELDLALVAA